MAWMWNSADKHANITLSNGDMTATKSGSGAWEGVRATDYLSGKMYFEYVPGQITAGGSTIVGIAQSGAPLSYPGADTLGYGFFDFGSKYYNTSGTSYGDIFSAGDVIGCAVDLVAGKIWWSINNVWQNGGDPVAGTGEAYSGLSGNYYPMVGFYRADFGTVAFDYADQVYYPPEGYSACEGTPPADVIWNSGDKAANITLSGSDLIATRSGGGSYEAVRSNKPLPSTGKHYFEIYANSVVTGMMVGIGTASEILTYPGDTAEGYGWNSNGDFYNGGSKAATAFQTGDVIGIAVDMDAGKIWFAQDNVWESGGDPGAGTGEIYSGLSGIFYAMFAGYGSGCQGTGRFVEGDYTYSPPSGFSAYESNVTVTALVFTMPGVLAGSITVGLMSPEFVSPGEMTAGVYTGAWVTSEAFGLAGSLSAPTLYISLDAAPWIVPATFVGSPQVSIFSPEFSALLGFEPITVFAGPMITADIFSLSGSISASLGVTIRATLLATKTLSASLLIGLNIPSLSLQGAISDPAVQIIRLVNPVQRFYFTLTGAADGEIDVTIPISSFSARMKSGDPTYLSVVIPNLDYALQVADRPNGDLVIKMAYEVGGVIQIAEEIVRVDLENIQTEEGGINQSIILDGHRTITHGAKSVNLSGGNYRKLHKGKLRYRCEPHLYVRPGDTVSIEDDSFIADNISLSVSGSQASMEVAEA